MALVLNKPRVRTFSKSTFLANLEPIQQEEGPVAAIIPVIEGSSWTFTPQDDWQSPTLAPGTAEVTTTGADSQDVVHYGGEGYYFSFDNAGINFYLNWGTPLTPSTVATFAFANGPWYDGQVLADVQSTFPITGDKAIALVYRRPDENIVLLKGVGVRTNNGATYTTAVQARAGMTRLVSFTAVNRIYMCARYTTGITCYINSGTAGGITTGTGSVGLPGNTGPAFRGMDWNSDGTTGVWFFLYRLVDAIYLGRQQVYGTGFSGYFLNDGSDLTKFHVGVNANVASMFKTSTTTAVGFYPTLDGAAMFSFSLSGTGNTVTPTLTATKFINLSAPLRQAYYTSVGFIASTNFNNYYLGFDGEFVDFTDSHPVDTDGIMYFQKNAGFIAHPGTYKGTLFYP